MKKHFIIGIAGVGVVGGALRDYFIRRKNTKLIIYDKYKNIGSRHALDRADIVFICVPTPYTKGYGHNISAIHDVIRNFTVPKFIVIKSTVLPGTTESLQKRYRQHTFIFNPEFLRAAYAYEDMVHPDRQIVGYTRKASSKQVCRLALRLLPRAPFTKTMSATQAEVVKYFTNSFLALKVAFANQIYDLCKKLNISYDVLIDAVGVDKRINVSHLKVIYEGKRGYRGHCLPKDVRAFLQLSKKLKVDFSILNAAQRYNDRLTKN